ncbi:MAG: hypothetical protein ACQEQM_06945 [Thermoplasmatota archaeon]
MARFITNDSSLLAMLDYLSSKMVWIVAAIVMTSSIMGIFVWQRESSDELELEIRARGIRDIVNKFCNTDGEVKAEISFNESTSSDLKLKPTINDKPYKLNFTSSGLFLNQDRKSVWNRFTKEVYIFNPNLLDSGTSIGILDRINIENHHMSISSHEDFIIETKEFNDIHHVFIYREIDDEIKNETRRIKNIIEQVTDWTIEEPEDRRNITVEKNMTFKNDYYYVNTDTLAPVNTDNLYLWKPETNSTTRESLEKRSIEHREIYVDRQQNITVQTKLMDIDGNITVLNYLYKP